MSLLDDGVLSLAIFVGGGVKASDATRLTAGAESGIGIIWRKGRMFAGDFLDGDFDGEFSPL
jgi:hypothetical protein